MSGGLEARIHAMALPARKMWLGALSVFDTIGSTVNLLEHLVGYRITEKPGFQSVTKDAFQRVYEPGHHLTKKDYAFEAVGYVGGKAALVGIGTYGGAAIATYTPAVATASAAGLAYLGIAATPLVAAGILAASVIPIALFGYALGRTLSRQGGKWYERMRHHAQEAFSLMRPQAYAR